VNHIIAAEIELRYGMIKINIFAGINANNGMRKLRPPASNDA
jgi:peptidyl-tRNA hydrolase